MQLPLTSVGNALLWIYNIKTEITNLLLEVNSTSSLALSFAPKADGVGQLIK